MMQRTIKQIAAMIEFKGPVESYQDVLISGVSIDSRNISPGSLFVPLQGKNTDGHQYVEQALQSGAAASLWKKGTPPPENLPVFVVDDPLQSIQELARAYRKQLQTKFVGITGSNGKTSTKDILASILGRKFRVQKTSGNLNNEIGVPLTILSIQEDTEIAIVEMAMRGLGQISVLTEITKPDIAIITNIGEAHLQELGSRENIAIAKFEIIQGLSAEGLFIYHGDEVLLQELIEQKDLLFKIKTFGASEMNDVFPTTIKEEINGSYFQVNGSDETFYLSFPGAHQVQNTLAALLVARSFLMSDQEIYEGLLLIDKTSMRMEVLHGKNGTLLINDVYNASPASMRAALNYVVSIQEKKYRIAVLGDMYELGENEVEYHREVGRSIDFSKIDMLFTIGSLGAEIANGANEKNPMKKMFICQSKTELVEQLMPFLNNETMILLKASRGMKLEEVVSMLVDENEKK